MKIGDNVVCINEANFGKNWEGIEYIYKLNKHYEIKYINNVENYVNVICFDDRYITFSLNENHQFKFKDYFLNLKEQRKLKLQKLNGSTL